MVVNCATNRWGTANFIVAPTLAEGAGYTTIAAALTAASSGDTIFIKPGTYTEDLTLKAGVNLVAYVGDADTPNVSIVGKLTATFAGTCSISGIRLTTNSDNFLVVSGTAATIVNLIECYLDVLDNTGITYSSSSSSSAININQCRGDIGTTGIALYTGSGAGSINLRECYITNTGATVTACSHSSGGVSVRNSNLFFPFSNSSTATMNSYRSLIQTEAQNTTSITVGGPNTYIEGSTIISGTASSISVTGSCGITNTGFNTTNTSVVTGAGTCNYVGLENSGTGDGIDATTTVAFVSRPGITRSAHQPAFRANQTTIASNVTGDGTGYFLGDTDVGSAMVENYDTQGDFVTGASGGATYTVPYTGYYSLGCYIQFSGIVSGHDRLQIDIYVDGTQYEMFRINAFAVASSGVVSASVSQEIFLNTNQVVKFRVLVDGGTKVVDIGGNAVRTVVYGHLMF